MYKYIDDAFLAGLKTVHIIHGRGEGILRNGLRAELKKNKHVKSFHSAPYNDGGEGCTIVELKDRK
jgi:DNA mismatch repair protein MutS2